MHDFTPKKKLTEKVADTSDSDLSEASGDNPLSSTDDDTDCTASDIEAMNVSASSASSVEPQQSDNDDANLVYYQM